MTPASIHGVGKTSLLETGEVPFDRLGDPSMASDLGGPSPTVGISLLRRLRMMTCAAGRLVDRQAARATGRVDGRLTGASDFSGA